MRNLYYRTVVYTFPSLFSILRSSTITLSSFLYIPISTIRLLSVTRTPLLRWYIVILLRERYLTSTCYSAIHIIRSICYYAEFKDITRHAHLCCSIATIFKNTIKSLFSSVVAARYTIYQTVGRLVRAPKPSSNRISHYLTKMLGI